MGIKSFFATILQRLQSISETPADVTAYEIENMLSDKMAAHLSLIADIYEGNDRVPWLQKDIKPLRLINVIAHEVTRNVISEADIHIDGTSQRAQYLNEQLTAFLPNLPNFIEQAIALGNMAIKPYINKGNIYVNTARMGNFIPVKANAAGQFTACVFVNQTIYKGNAFIKLEYHHIDNDIYTIENTAYKFPSAKKISPYSGFYGLGAQVDLTTIPEWADISPFVQLTGDIIPLYAIYRNPFANNIDPDSQLGVSIISNCIDLLEQADKAWEILQYEIKSGERRVFLPPSALINKGEYSSLSRFYKAVDFDNDNEFVEFSPALRNESIQSYIQEIYKRIELNSGLSYGVISDPQSVAATATQIMHSKDVLKNTVNIISSAVKTSLEQLVTAMNSLCDLYGLTQAGEYQLIVSWGDNTLETTEEKQNRAIMLYQNGIIDRVELLKEVKGITTEEAETLVQTMQEREKASGSQSTGFFNEGA